MPCKDRVDDTCWMEGTGGGAVTQKPGYTLHCVACTVTLQDACEMGSLVGRVSGKNSKSFWSFGAERKMHGWTPTVRFPFHKSVTFHIHALLDSFWIHCTEWAVIFLSSFKNSQPAAVFFLLEWTGCECFTYNLLYRWSRISCLKAHTITYWISLMQYHQQ